jgi:transposase
MNYKLFVGIDQSKLTFDAAVFKKDEKSTGEHCQFKNDTKGFNAFIKWVKAFGDYSLEEILFCSENTGIYSLKLSIFLCELKANLWLENALQIKRSVGFQRGKSDKADAKMIAQYCCLHSHKAKLYSLPSKPIRALKQLLTYRERLIKMQAQLKGTNKEMKKFKADCTGIINKQSDSLIKILLKQIETVNQEMMNIIKENDDLRKQFDLVKSVHGIGNQTALSILVCTNGFTSFDDWRKFTCYCGIAPFEYSSGTSIRGKTRISHFGNKKIKSLLTMCALNTIKKKNEFKNYYDRRINQGKSAMSTINILRNKLISRIFATVRRGTPYQNELAIK